MATINDTDGNDTLIGTAEADTFIVNKGGEDRVSGLGGNDIVSIFGTLDAGDHIDGGDGSDQLWLRGDYSAGLTLTSTTLTSIERIALGAGNSYAITSNDGNVAAGATLTVDGSKLGAANFVHFDGTAETDGSLDLIGGAGNDVLKGGSGGDTFDMRKAGGEDTITGGSGNDLILAGANLDSGDVIDAGGGTNNVMRFAGDYAGLTLSASMMTNIHNLQFNNGNYTITADASAFVPGTQAYVTGVGINSSHSLDFDASASAANIKFTGGAGADVLTGGSGADNFDLSAGGVDIASGGGGNDLFTLGAAFTPSDQIDGGAGSDRLEINGDLAMTFQATTMVNVETLILDAGHNYAITLNDGNVAAGQTLLVRGEALGAGNTLHFNGNAETDGSFTIRGGAGNDWLAGGAQADTFNMTLGGDDVVKGNAGDDTISMGATLTAADKINGGLGNDTLQLNGDYSAGVTFGATTVLNVETISLAAGHSYSLTTNDATVAAGAAMTVDGSALGASDHLVFDGSAETDGSLAVKGGAGDDTITLGANAPLDSVDGGGGTNTLVLAANPSDGVSGDDTIGATNYQNIDKIVLASGAYEFDITGDISGTHKAFTVDATALAAINQGISASITISGTPDAVTYLGGAGSDLVAYSADAAGSAGATIDTNGGDDEIALTDVNSAALINVDGGAGNNIVFLQDTNGDTSLVTLAAAHYTDIQNVEVGDAQPLAITGDITGGSGALFVREDVGGSVDLSGATTAALSFQGSTGNDTLILGANAANVTTATGNNTTGTPVDTIELVGGVSNFTLSSAHFSQFTNIVLADGASYTGDAITGNISAHNKITIDASALTGSNAASLDLSGANISNIVFTGGAGDDSITLASAAASSAKINGGAGSDTIHSAGAFSLNSNASNIERVVYTNSGSTGSVSISGDITSGGGMLTIDASGVSTAVTTNFITLAGATTAAFNITGGAGNDLISLNAFNANDKVVGGGGFNEIALASNQAGFAITSANFTNVSEIDVKGTADVSGFSVVGDLTQGSGSAGTFTFYADQQSGKLAVDLSGVTTTNIQFDGATGADTVTFGTGNFANAKLSGEGGNDTAIIQGNGTDYTYAGAINFQKLSQIDNLDLDGANNFTLSFGSGLAATLRTFTVDASGITGGKHATLDFSGVDNTSTINVTGSAGDDVVIFGNEFGQLASLNGGAGNDTLEIAGVKPTLNATNVSSVETVALLNTTASLTTGVSIVGDITSGGGVLHFDTTAMSAGHTAIVTTVAATTAVIDFTGGVTNDVLSYGTFNAADQFVGGGGSNEVSFGTGQAGFAMSSANFSNVNVIALGSGITGMSVVGDLTQGTSSAGDLSVVASGGTGVSIDFTGTTTAAIDFTGNDGNDTVIFSAGEDNWGHLDGGKGNNMLELTGGGSATLSGSSIHDFNALTLTNGHYSQVTVTGDITTGAPSLTIDASATTGANIDLSAATTSLINVTGGTGDDYVIFSAFNAAATFVGGDGYNEIAYQSPQSGLTFTSANYSNVDEIDFNGTGDYTNISVAGDLTAGGDNAGDFDVYAGQLNGTLTVDLSAVTTAEIDFEGGTGDDSVTLSTANFNNAFLYGGGGNDTAVIAGDGTDFTSQTISSRNDQNIANFVLTGDNNFTMTFGSGLAAATGSLTVDASALTAGHSAIVDFSHATTSALNFTGGAGDDTVIFSSDNGNWGTVNGGAGNNTFEFNDGTATIVDGASVTNFSTLSFADGHDYSGIHVTGDITGNNGTLNVDASAVSSGHTVDVDLSGVTSSGIEFTGGAADDTVVFGANLANVVSADGGGGNNTLALAGDGQDVTTTFSGANLANFSDLALEDGNGYAITVTGGFGGEAGLNIDASALSAQYGATIDVSGLTNFSLDFTGGAGNDTVLAGADLANMTIDGGGGNDVLNLDGDYSAGVTLSSVSNIGEIDLAGGNSYNLTTTDATVAAGATLTVDASALGTNFGLTFDGSAETDGYFDIKGGAGDDSLTLQTFEVDNSTIDGGGGFNTVTMTGNHAGDETFDATTFTHINTINYAAGSDAGFVSFTGDITGDGSTLTVDETNADGVGGSGPDGDMVITDISALTDTIDFTGGVVDDYVGVSSQNWTSLNGNGGNYNAIDDVGTGPITFDAATITGFNALVFANSTDYAGIAVVGDITGNGGTVAIAATYANSISIDVSQATSSFAFTGSAGDDTIAFGNGFTSSDTVAGGGGNDTLSLGRNNVTLADTAVTGISTVVLSGGSAFAVTGDISANGVLTVDASALSDPHDVANINFSQATTGVINFASGAGGDRVTFSASEANWGTVDGGTGDNNFILTGGGTASIDGASVTDFSTIVLRDGGSYTLILSGDIQGGGQTLTVGAGALSDGNDASVDASASTDNISFTGGAGDDTFTGSSHGDTIALGFGGIDTVYGGAGDDTITAKASTVGGDFLDGGAGANVLSISGVGEADLNGATITNIETLNLSSTDLVITGDITGGQALTVNVTDVSGATIDLTQATTGTIDVNGGAGDDTVIFGSNLADAGTVDGGGGINTLALAGDGSDLTGTFDGSLFSNFSALGFVDGNNYNVTVTNGFGGGGLTIDASALSASYGATVDVSQVTGTVDFTGGAGDDTVIFGTNFAVAASIDGGGGNDTLAVGQGGTLSDTTISHIENVDFSGDASSGYDVSISGDLTSGGGTLSLDASQVQNGGVTFDLTGATTTNFDVVGSGGEDTIILGPGENLANFNSDGNFDTLELTGGSTGLTVDAATILGIAQITFDDGASYTGITLIGDIVDNGGPLTIDASALTGSNSVDVDASQATTGGYFVTGGAGDDNFVFGGNIGQVNTLDGGGGTNTLALNGNGNDVNTYLNDTNFQNIENVVLDDGNNYSVNVNGDITGGHGTLSIDASALSSAYGASIVTTGATTPTIDILGGAGDDFVAIGSAQGTVDFTQGGDDTFQGYGNATVEMGGALTAADSISGAAVVLLDGDYSAGLTLGAATLSDIGTLSFAGGHSYNITTNDGNVGNGATMTADASALGASDSLTFDGSAETDGAFDILGGAGNDSLTGGAQADSFDLTAGGTDTVRGGGGDDIITVKAVDLAGDTIDGGTGNDTIMVSDAPTLALSDTNISNVENVNLADGDSCSVTVTGDITSGGSALSIDASAFTGTNAATVDANGATTTAVNFTGGAGDDTAIFSGYGANLGTVDGGVGNNTLQDAGGFTLSDATVTHIQNVVYSDDNYSAGLTVTGDITGGSGALHIDASGVGNGANDFVDLTGATTPVIDFTGGASQDTVTFGSNFSSNDVLNGGPGSSNTLQFDGNGTDVTAALSDSQISNFDAIAFYDGNSYNLTVSGDITSGGGTLNINASALTSGNGLTLDLSAATTTSIQVIGGAGNDTITTGATIGDTNLDLSQGGEDTVHGGSAADYIYMGNALDTGDRIDGGGGYNYVYLEGDAYAGGFDLGAGELANVNYVKLFGDHTYVLTGDPAALNSSDYVTIDGGAMTGGSLQFDGSAVTDGAFSLYGGAGDDILKGGTGNDTLDLSVGGEDQLAGNGGNDIINAGGGLDAGDTVDGGTGSDTLNFAGDYSGGLVLGATTVTNVETFKFAIGYSYNITTDDATVAPGATLTVNAATLGASNQLIFNGSAETNGSFTITGGAGNDVLTGGAGNDIFHLADGGDDTIQGGAGNDTIFGETGYSSGDMIDGGTGSNIFWLGGKDYTGASAVTFTAANFLNIQTVELNSSHNYSLTMNDANVPAGATMLVDGHLAASFTFDGSAETDGHFTIVASTGADVLAGGALSDTFVFDTVNYSTGTAYDAITNLNFSSDILELNAGAYMPTGIDTAVTSGSLSAASFNTDLASDLTGHLAAHHAVLFTASAGTLAGHTFLVVDANGTAGYQASADYVIDVTGYSGTLTTGSFT